MYHAGFFVRGVAAVIMKAGSFTAQVPDGLTVLHLHYLGPYGIAFLMDPFNLSVAGVTYWQLGRKPSSASNLLLWPAAKILKRLLLPTIVEALGTHPSQHSFKQIHSTTSSLLFISPSVVSGPQLPLQRHLTQLFSESLLR